MVKRELKNILIGIFLILLSFLLFITFTFWLIITKLPSYGKISNEYDKNWIFTFMKNDKVYCLFLPILIPFTFVWFYFKWIAFNYFKRSD